MVEIKSFSLIKIQKITFVIEYFNKNYILLCKSFFLKRLINFKLKATHYKQIKAEIQWRIQVYSPYQQNSFKLNQQ